VEAGTSNPVIYVIAASDRQQFDYESFRPHGFPTGRPDAQGARFMHVGWGHATNACARRILIALYLDPSGDYGPLAPVERMFPASADDKFSAFLSRMMTYDLPPNLKRALEKGYYELASAL
jgi:hypothetical protein